MAKITFKTGDCFTTETGHGIVTSRGKALIITGGGGRTGWKQKHDSIPQDAVPTDLEGNVPYEVKFALKTVLFLLAVQSSAAKH